MKADETVRDKVISHKAIHICLHRALILLMALLHYSAFSRGRNINHATFLDAEGNVFETTNSFIVSANIAIKLFGSDLERISKLGTCFAFRICIGQDHPSEFNPFQIKLWFWSKM